jgi:hypothetical protein
MGSLSELRGLSGSMERPMSSSFEIRSERLPPPPRLPYRKPATYTEIASESGMTRPRRGTNRFTDEPVPAPLPMGHHPS